MRPESALNPDEQVGSQARAPECKVSGFVHPSECYLPLLLRRSYSGVTVCKPCRLQAGAISVAETHR